MGDEELSMENGSDLGDKYLFGGMDNSREIGLASMLLMALLSGKQVPLIGRKTYMGRGSAQVNTKKAASEAVSVKEHSMMLVSNFDSYITHAHQSSGKVMQPL